MASAGIPTGESSGGGVPGPPPPHPHLGILKPQGVPLTSALAWGGTEEAVRLKE